MEISVEATPITPFLEPETPAVPQKIPQPLPSFTGTVYLFGKGYDHNLVLDDTQLECAARVEEPISGRTLEVFTGEPGMQFYSFNHIEGVHKGKNNTTFSARSAFCLESQHFPNSPNQPNFPSAILNPGEKYTSYCHYKFDVRELF